jgi:glutamine amidotransferase
MTPTIAVIDYGAGNLRSIRRALDAAGARVVVTSDPAEVAAADGVVLPGVGAAGAAMERLRELGLIPAIDAAVTNGRPFFGICLGMQLLFGHQDEGDIEGLGLLAGSVRALDGPVKAPQIGWNRVRLTRTGPLGEAGEEAYFYFVHSFVVAPDNADDIVAETRYGETFPSLVAHDNVWGAQFHPEKSGEDGLALVQRFVERVRQQAGAGAAAAVPA